MIVRWQNHMQNIFKRILQIRDKYNSLILFDSRLIKQNDIFIGIKSKNRDGNLFTLDAIKKGANLAITDNNKIIHDNVVFVKDVQLFIKKFNQFLLDIYNGKIIAISGSVGKTTTKENIFHILNDNQLKAYRSFKNFNNILGLQFSIMNMDIKSKFAIFEIGINAPKEMDNLIKILQPHYSLLTSIEDSHIGNFKNFSDLFANKIKIFNSRRLIKGLVNSRKNDFRLPIKISNKVDLVNLDNLKIKTCKQKLFTISFKYNDHYKKIYSDKDGIFSETAVLSFLFLNLFIKKFSSKKFFFKEAILDSRGKIINKHYNNKIIRIYDHSYNASPYSLKKQLIYFDNLKVTKKFCIIGSVKELGDHTEKFHRALLKDINALKVKRIILIGEEFYKLRTLYKTLNFYKSYKNYIKVMKKDLEFGKNIFVMGSRLNKLDKVIQNIC